MIRHVPITLLPIALLLPTPAAAHYVADEFTIGGSQPTPSNPRSAYLTNKVIGLADLRENLTLRLDASWTYDVPSPPSANAKWGTSAASVFNFSLSTSWDVNDHVNLGLEVDGSPPSTQLADSTLTYCPPATPRIPSAPVDIETQVQSNTWSTGGSISAGYDTSGDSKAETAVDGLVNFLLIDTSQRNVQAVDAKGLAVAPGDVGTYCAAHPKNAFCPHVGQLGQFKFGASVVETLYSHFDIGLTGNYYVYTTDPYNAGSYSQGAAFRGATQFGAGIPIAPYQFSAIPDFALRFGGFSGDLSFTFAQYQAPPAPTAPCPGGAVTNTNVYGYDTTLALKLQYKFTKHFRMWLKGSAQRDVDPQGGLVSNSGSLSLGARVTF